MDPILSGGLRRIRRRRNVPEADAQDFRLNIAEDIVVEIHGPNQVNFAAVVNFNMPQKVKRFLPQLLFCRGRGPTIVVKAVLPAYELCIL